MNKIIIAVILPFVVSNTYARELLPEEASVVESAVKQGLKDPYSAHFVHGDFPETDKNFLYCGLVNAKNSYGAYTGNQLFSVSLFKNDKGEFKAISMDKNFADDKPLDQEIIAASCASAGYPVKVKKYLVKNVNKSRQEKGLPKLTPAQITSN